MDTPFRPGTGDTTRLIQTNRLPKTAANRCEESETMARANKEAQDAETEEEKAIANLQYAMDRACRYIHDAPTASISYRALQAAQAGVDKKVVSKALDAVEAAVKDAKKAVQEAFDNPEEATVSHSRVRLDE